MYSGFLTLCSESSILLLDELYVPPSRGNGDFRLLPPWFQTRRKDVRRGGGDVVSTISFIQANFQHDTAASRILSRTVVVKGNRGIYIALIL